MEKLLGLVFVLFGIGLVAVAFQGVSRGWLPNGPNGYKQGKGVRKDEQPLGFWIMFAIYAGGGGYIVVMGIQALMGHAPIPAR